VTDEEDDGPAAGDNPAQRLLAILRLADVYRYHQDMNAAEAWMTIFDIKGSPTAKIELLKLGAQMMELAAETRATIDRLGSGADPLFKKSLILEPFRQVEETLVNFLQVGADMAMFEFCHR
jgi:hypothetical protein